MIGPLPSRCRDTLAARVRCYYADPARRIDRPHCQDVGVVAYGIIVLCRSCDTMRSAVGQSEVARLLPGAELLEVNDAATELSRAEEHVAQALRRARGAGASWTEVGEALGISRQAARSRFASDYQGGVGSSA